MSFLLLAAALSTASGPGAPVDCAGYYYFADGRRIETVTLDARGSVKSRKLMTVRAGQVAPRSATALLTTRSLDTREPATTSEARCENGDLLLDLTGSLPSQKEALSSRSPVLLRYPGGMRVGDALESRVDFDLDGESKGKTMKVRFSLSDRRVRALEAVDTPQGRKQAFVIRSTLNISFRVIGIAIPMRYELVEFFVPGLGVMRTEAEEKGKTVERSTVRFLN